MAMVLTTTYRLRKLSWDNERLASPDSPKEKKVCHADSQQIGRLLDHHHTFAAI
jgi:hypothetical protein